MNPYIPLFMCTATVLYLLYYDNKHVFKTSWFFNVALLWFLIVGSRMISLWFYLPSANADTDMFFEGNPIDRNLFSAMLFLGVLCLWKRRVKLSHVVRNNKWLTIFLIYCLASLMWSDYPYISCKRLIKYFGNAVMVLVVLTESDRFEAIKALLRRASYVLMSFSLVLFKYFPSYGRIYHRYSGDLSITGVTTNKNTLGAIAMLFSIYYVYELVHTRKKMGGQNSGFQVFMNIAFLCLSLYMLYKARSVTSQVCFLLGFILVLISRTNIAMNNSESWGLPVFAAVSMGVVVELIFHPIDYLILSFGRDLTLTTRTDLWKDIIAFPINRFIGCGFDTFWLGDRMNFFWEKHWWHPTEAHNGYLEMIVELGIVGLVTFLIMLGASIRNLYHKLGISYDENVFKIILAVIFILYNISETAFKGTHFMCFIMFLCLLGMPINKSKARAKQTAHP